MTRFIRLGTVILAVGAAACASSGSHATGSGGPARWEGSFRTTQNTVSAVIGSGQQNKAAGYGTLKLTPVAGPPSGVQAEVSISAPVSAGTQLAWAIFTGSCGAMSAPMIGAMQFPTIEIANSGNGFVRANLPMSLDPQGSYHANVYWNSQATDVSNVMMCANLALANR